MIRPGRADVVISSDLGRSLIDVRDDTHVFDNGLTHADVRDIVDTVFRKRAERARRSRDNCEYVREQMRLREPRIHAALDKAVRDA